MRIYTFLAVLFMFLGSMASAQHAVSVELGEEPAAASEPAAADPAVTPTPQPAPQVEVSVPSELDLYVVPAATRQVCTTSEWGFDEIRTDCRTLPIALERNDPALRGLCITRYGHRTCY
jgi:hypothetical protein